MVGWRLCLAISCSALLSVSAAAQELPVDTVVLRDGGRIRGTVIYYVAEEPLRIRTLDGQDVIVPADDVAEVRFAEGRVRERPATRSSSSTDAAPILAAEGSIRARATRTHASRSRRAGSRRSPSAVDEASASSPRRAGTRVTLFLAPGAMINASESIGPGGLLEAGVWLDFGSRRMSGYRFGIGFSGTVQANGESAGRSPAVANGTVRLSIWPLALTPDGRLAVRIGADVALHIIPDAEAVDIAARPILTDLAVVLGGHRRVQLGLMMGLLVHRAWDGSPASRWSTQATAQARLGVTL